MDRKILENRLVTFSSKVLQLCRKCQFDMLTVHLPKQIVRSSSSAALNYAESHSAESKADFIHKLSITLKELRETMINLKMINNSGVFVDPQIMEDLLKENNELIAIFQKSINTLINHQIKENETQ